MKIILLVVLILTFLGTLFILYKEYIKRKMLKSALEKLLVVKPLIEKLRDNEDVTSHEILAMSENPSLRLAIYRLMEAHNKMHLFPETYLTREKGAESFLVNWLEFPTELGTTPDYIEFLMMITLTEQEALDYYVFKFTVNPPHWAAREWLLGTCGPYRKHSLPYDIPSRIFSRFNALDSISPLHEVEWVHANINKN
ncbi:MAG TPA: hypothetical protein VK666_27590 [Chryseolinea sp.]|nr:hypothetical protein [Chryseolinea sp.]